MCQDAFQRLKDLITGSTVLAFPDFSQEFLLETDASKEGLGAGLSQDQPSGVPDPLPLPAAPCNRTRRTTGVQSWRD